MIQFIKHVTPGTEYIEFKYHPGEHIENAIKKVLEQHIPQGFKQGKITIDMRIKVEKNQDDTKDT